MRKGFTLLELLIVVVILGVLALIAAPTLLNAADQAKVGTVKANISAAASSATSALAVNPTNKTPSTIAGEVATKLSTDNKNPIDSTKAAFANAGTDPGSVVLVGDDTNNKITITGYDKKGVEVLKKVVSGPDEAQ